MSSKFSAVRETQKKIDVKVPHVIENNSKCIIEAYYIESRRVIEKVGNI